MVLAYFVVGLAVMHAGHYVIDPSTTPPSHHVTGRLVGSLPGIGVALFSLACIFVSMWKRWDFEIVGWVLLLVFIFAGIGH